MKKILMIAPSSYPVTGAEAIVNIKLLKVLSDSQQFSIDLISRRWKWEHYPSDSFDSLGIQLNSLSIVEVDNVINVSTIVQNILTYLKFGLLYKGYHWAYPAWKIVKKKLESAQYDYVLTKDVPSLLIGYYLQKHYKIKWVATWNDPCPWVMYPQPYGKGVGTELTKMQKKIIKMMKAADIHIFPNPRLRDYMNQYLQLDEKQCLVVPHVIIPPSSRIEHTYTKKLRLIHSGNLANPRNPSTFLHALRMFLDKNSHAEISFTILGHCEPEVKNLITRLGLEKYVCFLTPVEYKESLQLLSSYDIAVIIEADCEEGIFLPTKVSDFMQMSIPIFAISPQVGVLNDLYKEKQISYFACVREKYSICAQLEKMYNDFVHQNLHNVDGYMKEMTSEYVVQKYLSI